MQQKMAYAWSARMERDVQNVLATAFQVAMVEQATNQLMEKGGYVQNAFMNGETMGIHTWTHYVGEEKACCEGLKTMLDCFCFGCHTPDDVGGCHNCKIGQANMMMLDYLKKNIKPNKDLKRLVDVIEKEEEFYRFIRLRSKFTPKKPSRKYVQQAKKHMTPKGYFKYNKLGKLLVKVWASNNQECDSIRNMIDKLKEAKTIY